MDITMADAIKVLNLTKKFKTVNAVNNISFTVPKGKIFGFLGPNGAGKTTTISILCTLLKPSSGQSLINGFNCVNQAESVRQSIGIVFQDPSLDERLTAWDNLEFHGMIYNLSKTKRRKQIDHVLGMVKLSDRRNEIVRTFSGGMKRRLEIARGLIHNPSVLFLDEPTLGLDPQTRNHIWAYIKKIRKEHNITIFLTTHYMEEAENCDDIAIIDEGEIIALNSPDNLKTMISKNKITLFTKDNKLASKQIIKHFNLSPTIVDGHLDIEVDNAERIAPKLMKILTVQIDTIKLAKPSLEDVFLHLTGKTIRDETLSSGDQMKMMARYRRRRR